MKPPNLLPLSEGARLLIVRRDNIGDLICTTPLMRALRAALPAAHLAVLTNDYAAPALAGNPDIDAVYCYGKAKHRAGKALLALYWQRWRLLRQLRAQRFDLAILAGSAHSVRALAHARAVRPRHILGYAPAQGQPPKALDWPLPPPATDLHHVEAVFGLLAPLGINGPPPALRLVPPDTGALRAQLAAAGLPVDGRPLIALHLSARKPSQRWPIDHFARLIPLLAVAQPATRFLLLWSPGAADDAHHPGDDDKAAALVRLLQTQDAVPVGPTFAASRRQPAFHALPTRTLSELIAALALVDGFIGSDGGAMHLAAALGKPVVCLFGASDAHHWHPWGVPYALLQREHVAAITPEEVLAAWQELAAH